MKKRKKSNKQETRQPKETRLNRAKAWLPTYNGTKIVKAYRKKFNVDIPCAVRELQEIGYEFKPGYVDNLLKSEAIRIEQRKRKKEEKRLADEHDNSQNDMFYFIAGYTSGGAPYGITWDEMGLEPYESESDDDDIVCFQHYEFLPKKQKDSIDNRIREDFSRFVEEHGRFPVNDERHELVKKVFATCPGEPLLYSNDFIKTYRKIIKKRENKFINEGILPYGVVLSE